MSLTAWAPASTFCAHLAGLGVFDVALNPRFQVYFLEDCRAMLA